MTGAKPPKIAYIKYNNIFEKKKGFMCVKGMIKNKKKEKKKRKEKKRKEKKKISFLLYLCNIITYSNS